MRTTWYNAAKVSDNVVLGSCWNTLVDLPAFKPCVWFDGLHFGVTLGVRHKGPTYVSPRGFQHLFFVRIFRSQCAHETQFVFSGFLVTMDPLTECCGDTFEQRLVYQFREPNAIL